MIRPIPTTLAAIAAAALLLPTVAQAGLQEPQAVRVDPAAGDDARCALAETSDAAVAATACRSLGRAVALVNAGPVGGSNMIILDPGRHAVSDPLVLRRAVSLVGRGGTQALVRLTDRGSLRFNEMAMIGGFVLGGSASGTWLDVRAGGSVQGMTVVRLAADAPTLRLTGGPGTQIGESVVVALGHPVAIVMKGMGYVVATTVSGGRLAVATAGGREDDPAPLVYVSVLAGGLAAWGGRPQIISSAVSVPESWNAASIEVAEEPGFQAVVQMVNEPRVVMSSIWQTSCAPAIALSRPAAAGRRAYILLAGSLVRFPAPGCSLVAAGDLGAGRGMTRASIVNNWFTPVPGPLALLEAWGRFDWFEVAGAPMGDPQVEGGVAGRNWPGGMMPTAGSPLINAATDPFSLAAAGEFPASLSTWEFAVDGMRPPDDRNLHNPAPDIGAYERSGVLDLISPPVPPGPPGVDIRPDGDDGGLAPVINDLPGAIPGEGAPVAGADTGQRAPQPSTGRLAGVGVHVGKTAPVRGPVRVRVRVSQASRVVVVLRRAFRAQDRVKRSRVIGKVVARFTRPGARWIKVPLNSGARRGLVGVAVTARRPGYDAGFAQASTRLVGRDPTAITAPATLRAGANRITVTTQRAGRVVVVARSAAGRVLGKSVFIAAGAGRRTITLTLAPAGLVTGTITISARIAGADPVTITRPAG